MENKSGIPHIEARRASGPATGVLFVLADSQSAVGIGIVHRGGRESGHSLVKAFIAISVAKGRVNARRWRVTRLVPMNNL